MQKTIYIAGKVTGLPFEQVEQRFAAKERALTAQGFNVINPVSVARELGWTSFPWETIMKGCIILLTSAQEVHLLPCWQESRGAILEREIALKLGIRVVYPAG